MEIVINKEGKELIYELNEPTFDVKSLAISKLMKGSGDLDLIGAGKVVFDACYAGGAESLAKIQQDTNLYISICLSCANAVEIYEGELKKN